MDTVIGLILLAAIGYGLYRLSRLVFTAIQKERGLTPAQKDYRQRHRAAEKQLKQVNKTYEKSVKAAQKQLDEARNPKPIASFASNVKVFEDKVVLPDGTRVLTPAVHADVDTAGNFAQKHRSTLTRMGIGTAVAGPLGFMVGMAAKKSTDHDTRELFLMVQGDGWASVVKANPDAGLQVRNFAMQLNVAAQGVEAAKQRRQATITSAEQRLSSAKSNRQGIESAERHLAAVRATDPDAQRALPRGADVQPA